MSSSETASPGAASADWHGILDFLRRAEALKDTLRSGYTQNGRQESVAAHTWRLGLMAVLLHEQFPEVDGLRLIKMCLIHDLGEAIHGDIPAPEQSDTGDKATQERRDFQALIAPLPAHQQNEFMALWDEYEAAASPEAQLAKGLDKIETLLQHTQGTIRPISTIASIWSTGAPTPMRTHCSPKSARRLMTRRSAGPRRARLPNASHSRHRERRRVSSHVSGDGIEVLFLGRRREKG